MSPPFRALSDHDQPAAAKRRDSTLGQIISAEFEGRAAERVSVSETQEWMTKRIKSAKPATESDQANMDISGPVGSLTPYSRR
jgi:hypothetical protein